ncbi:hypothetical protein C0J52_12381 [Blattella germanica]|nr:hypothetical protein C0J52_12381 [Blattella germanica]
MGFESESTDASCDDLDSMYTISESGSSKTDRSYKCPIDGCGKGFNKPKRLEVHRPYKCTHEGCDKAYGVSQHLNRHIKNKHGPKSMYKKILRCPHPDCSLELSNQHNLKRHYYQFVCDTCGRSFKGKSRLKIHVSIHQEPSERDIFSCPYPNCPRFYFQKRNLTHHIKSSHEGKRFDCTYADCNREFCNKDHSNSKLPEPEQHDVPELSTPTVEMLQNLKTENECNITIKSEPQDNLFLPLTVELLQTIKTEPEEQNNSILPLTSDTLQRDSKIGILENSDSQVEFKTTIKVEPGEQDGLCPPLTIEIFPNSNLKNIELNRTIKPEPEEQNTPFPAAMTPETLQNSEIIKFNRDREAETEMIHTSDEQQLSISKNKFIKTEEKTEVLAEYDHSNSKLPEPEQHDVPELSTPTVEMLQNLKTENECNITIKSEPQDNLFLPLTVELLQTIKTEPEEQNNSILPLTSDTLQRDSKIGILENSDSQVEFKTTIKVEPGEQDGLCPPLTIEIFPNSNLKNIELNRTIKPEPEEQNTPFPAAMTPETLQNSEIIKFNRDREAETEMIHTSDEQQLSISKNKFIKTEEKTEVLAEYVLIDPENEEKLQKLEEHLKLHRTNRPPRRKKKPSKRCDTGIPKRSMAVKLSGIKVPYETEKRILNNYLNTPKKCSSFAEINPRNIFEECVMRDCISTDTRNKKLCETVTSEMVSEKPCETSGHIIESDNECERTKSKLTDVKNTKISDITAQCHVKKSSEEKENVKYKYISSGIININSDTMLPNSPLEKLTDTVVEFCNEEHFSNSVCDEISDTVHNFKILNCSNTLESEINLDPSMLLSSALENTNDIVNANMSVSDSNNTCDMDKNSDANLTNLDSVESYDPCNKLILGVKVGNKVHFFMPEANDNCDELLQKLCASRAREKEKENGIEDVRNLLSNDPSNHESLGSDNVNPPDSVSIQEKVQILADLEVKNDHSENCKSKSTEKSDFKSLLTDSDSPKGKTEHFEIVEHANSSEVKNIKMRISHRVIEEQRKSEIHDKNLQASVVSMHAEVNDQDRDSLEDSVQTFASVKDANSSGMKIIEMNVSQKRGNILDDCESLQSSEISNELNIEQCKDKILVSSRSSRFDEKTQSYVNDECMRSDKNSVKINKVLRVHNQRLNKSKIFNNELLLRAEDNGGQDSVDEFVECVKNNIDKQKDVVTGRKKWKCKSKETEYFHISSGNNVEFSARAQYSLDKVSPGDQYSIDESAESILNKRKDVENGKRKHRCKGKDSEYLCTSSSEENGEFIDAAKSFVAVHSSSVKVNHIQTAVSKNSKCRKILQKNGVNLNCKKRKIDNITSVESLCSPVGMDVVLVDENKYEEQKQSLDSSKNIQIGSEIVPVNIEKQLPKFYICKNTIRISHHPINEVESDTVKERPLNLLQICVNIQKSSEQIENIKENSTDIPMTESVVGELLHSTESCFLLGIERKRQNSVDVQTVDETLDCTNLEKGSAIPQINTTKKTDYNFKNSLSIALNGTESHETPQDVLKTMSSEETLPKDNNAKVKLPVKSNILGEENLNNLNYSCDTFKKSMREIEKHIIVTNKISDKLLTLMSIVSDYGNKSLSTQQSQEGKTDNNTINSLTAKCIYPPSNTSNLIEKEDRMEKHEMLKKNYQICSENGVSNILIKIYYSEAIVLITFHMAL